MDVHDRHEHERFIYTRLPRSPSPAQHDAISVDIMILFLVLRIQSTKCAGFHSYNHPLSSKAKKGSAKSMSSGTNLGLKNQSCMPLLLAKNTSRSPRYVVESSMRSWYRKGHGSQDRGLISMRRLSSQMSSWYGRMVVLPVAALQTAILCGFVEIQR